MEIALSPTTPGLSAADRVSLCVAAEANGYATAWLAEVAGPEAFSLAGAIAAATSSLDLGVAIVAAGNRTPALLGMGAATVSQLLGGRSFALGIGSSSEVIMEQWHGRSFASPLARVRETVEATRLALSGGRDYEGAHAPMAAFRLAGESSGPVPLYVGALGPRMLALAGAVADGVCLNMMPPQAVPRQLAEIEAGAAQAGRLLPPDFGVMARIHWAPGDPAAGRELVRGAFGPYFAQPVYNRFLGWCGYPEEAAAIAAAFAAGDRRALANAFTDEIVDGIALFGSAADARQRLEAFSEAGVGVAAISILAQGPDAVAEAMTALAT
jgi:probable F420-dependent oxidoreductase